MLGEIGNFCLILALCVSIVQSILPLAGTVRKRQSWMMFGCGIIRRINIRILS